MFGKIKKRWFCDSHEILLQKRKFLSEKNRLGSNQNILIQAPFDYYYLSLYALVIAKFKKEDKYNYIAVLPDIFRITPEEGLKSIPRFFIAFIDRFLIKRKWKKLYKGIGIENFYELTHIDYYLKIKHLSKALVIWKGLESKQNLLDLELEGIKCGDLIYDTYLRYRVKPTVYLDDWYLFYLIYQCFNVIKQSSEIADNNIKCYFTSYTTYIQHGVIVRTLKKKEIDIFTSGNFQQRFKKLKIEDLFHTAYYHKYRSDFEKMHNQEEKYGIASKLLTDKFSGIIDNSLSYMKSSSYKQEGNICLDTKKNVDGILFLHDFFDSPHIYGKMLFVDFYEWVIHTIKLINKYNLNIAIKPHPNQVEDSKKIIKDLQEKYPLVKWINPKVSNSELLNSGIKFGISIYGTVLHELAYHGIQAICAGDNPHSSYSFVHIPNSIEEYDSMIVGFKKLVLPVDYRRQVESFYFMHNINNKSDFDINLEPLKDYNFINSTSSTIEKVLPFL